jgi:hypothetical protein
MCLLYQRTRRSPSRARDESTHAPTAHGSMKLVLLPGLDGRGELFAFFVRELRASPGDRRRDVPAPRRRGIAIGMEGQTSQWAAQPRSGD